MKKISLLFFVLFCQLAFAQTNTQTIKGKIIDQQSKAILAGVTVAVISTEPMIGAATDANGNFRISNVAHGRHTLKVSLVGYAEQLLPNIVVTAGKETVVDIELEERINTLQEVSVRAVGQKTNIERGLTPVSAKVFDVDETRRYAGSRNDPARMAAGFAGVVLTEDSRNDIIIRGNSPLGLLWKLEGIDVPNPNHFGALGVTGGPVSMLNNNVLAKSSFLTGAFPSVYGNATAGVFDLQMKNGNADKREYMGQMGFNGLEAGAEGYFSKKSQASYLVNYRYSFLDLIKKLGIDFGTGSAIPRYQDLSVKINVPTQKLGTFAVFGLLGKSGIGFTPSTDANFYSASSTENLNYKTQMGVVGLSNTYFFNNKTYGKLTLSTSRAGVLSEVDNITKANDKITVQPSYRDDSYEQRSSLNYVLNTKFNAQHTLTMGVIANHLKMHFVDSSYQSSLKKFVTNRNFDGGAMFWQSYANWQWRPSDAFTINSGLYFQRFALNNQQRVEPRLGLRYNFNSKANINLGFGQHSQLQSFQVYFNAKRVGNEYSQPNKNLGFNRSTHWVLGYQQRLTPKLSTKIEVYHQSISGVPVDVKSSSFSLLNSGSDFGVEDRTDMVNGGSGRNYGIDFTLERTFDKYYFLITTSVFESKYKGSDGVERNTFYAGRYVGNILAGREFNLGKNKILAFDTRITAAGGKRFTPIDMVASKKAKTTVRDYTKTFEGQYKDYFRTDFKVTFRINQQKAMQEWFVDLNNLFNTKNVFSQSYSPTKDALTTAYQLGLFPNVNYRITF